MMWWAVWCAAAVVSSGASAAPATEGRASLSALDFAQMEPPAPDDEGLSYGLPPMGGRFAAGDPWLYLLADVPHDTQEREFLSRQQRSLAINPAFELLQRNAENTYWERIAHNNREFLDRVGKRDSRRAAEDNLIESS